MSDVWSGQEGSWAPPGEVLQVCPGNVAASGAIAPSGSRFNLPQKLCGVRGQHLGGGGGGLRQKLKNQDLDSSLFSFIRTSSRTSCFLHQAVSCSRTLVGERPTGGEQEEASGGEAMASRRIRLAEASAGPAAYLSAAAFAEVWLVNSSALTG